MPSLRDIQREFSRVMLGGDTATILGLIADDGMPAAARLDVHRNNVTSSLTDVLKDTFPAICRLVDDRFFAYAASGFIRAEPPERPCLSEYGARFPDFLLTFPPCRDFAYLPDVARLEWALHRAASAQEAPPLTQTSLRQIDIQDAPRLRFRFQPSYAYLCSPWPVDRIWRANRPGAAEDGAVDVGAGPCRIEVRRRNGNAELRELPAATFAFCHALSAGRPFDVAIDAALSQAEEFDPTGALAELVHDGALVDFMIGEVMP